jgi:hypothetical protein
MFCFGVWNFRGVVCVCVGLLMEDLVELDSSGGGRGQGWGHGCLAASDDAEDQQATSRRHIDLRLCCIHVCKSMVARLNIRMLWKLLSGFLNNFNMSEFVTCQWLSDC